ncbi:MAG: CYTH domain-containing protein [Lachnospiraceae bacterium]|nr:CYTH domain-containing protein [Lachnospiraceae bacterium]
MEIERKFTIKHLPENMDTYSRHIIEQAYLTTEPTIRVRREDDRYYMTYKGTGGGNTPLAHEEYNLPLTKQAYDTLSSKSDGHLIKKERVLIPYGKYTIELDIFGEPFADLIIAEVEFPSVDEAEDFTPPDWFDEDVTGRREYTNSYLSRADIRCGSERKR